MDSDVSPLTDESYWTRIWDGQKHKVRHLRWVYVANRQLGKLFHRALYDLEHPSVIELGCADSLWLPYLSNNFDCDCYGVDFSELGCHLAQRNLTLAGAKGTIICDDIFSYTKKHTAEFDFVYSMGLLEHFTSSQTVLKMMLSLLKPDGRMLTVIPNLRGMYTPIARIASPKLLATHQEITPKTIYELLLSVGFQVIEFGYTGGPLKLSVVDYSPWESVIGKWGHEVLCKGVNLTDIVVGNILAALRVPNQQLTSPYVYAISTNPR